MVVRGFQSVGMFRSWTNESWIKTKLGLLIPGSTKSYEEFVVEMKKSEMIFKNKLGNVHDE